MSRSLVLVLVLTACSSLPPSQPQEAPAPSESEPARETPPSPPTTAAARQISASDPLEAGLVVFEGLIRPTKGGYEVRGVILDDALLPRALQSERPVDAVTPSGFSEPSCELQPSSGITT